MADDSTQTDDAKISPSSTQPRLISAKERRSLILNLRIEELNPLLTLPEELCLKIFKMLDLCSLGRCSQVCRRWLNITADHTLWRDHAIYYGYQLSEDDSETTTTTTNDGNDNSSPAPQPTDKDNPTTTSSKNWLPWGAPTNPSSKWRNLTYQTIQNRRQLLSLNFKETPFRPHDSTVKKVLLQHNHIIKQYQLFTMCTMERCIKIWNVDAVGVNQGGVAGRVGGVGRSGGEGGVGSLIGSFEGFSFSCMDACLELGVLVAGSFTREIISWDLNGGFSNPEPLWVIMQHMNAVVSICLDGDLVVSSGWDNMLVVAKWRDGEIVGSRSSGYYMVVDIKIQGDIMVTGFKNKDIQIWKRSTTQTTTTSSSSSPSSQTNTTFPWIPIRLTKAPIIGSTSISSNFSFDIDINQNCVLLSLGSVISRIPVTEDGCFDENGNQVHDVLPDIVNSSTVIHNFVGMDSSRDGVDGVLIGDISGFPIWEVAFVGSFKSKHGSGSSSSGGGKSRNKSRKGTDIGSLAVGVRQDGLAIIHVTEKSAPVVLCEKSLHGGLWLQDPCVSVVGMVMAIGVGKTVVLIDFRREDMDLNGDIKGGNGGDSESRAVHGGASSARAVGGDGGGDGEDGIDDCLDEDVLEDDLDTELDLYRY
ncbi:hypothetical protein HDU76_007284 [Blyttiomyces sp. JEL0837]|nr:hypothetical protein HDU76_007284 [Blyttiomyces sp. JEL0837]